MNRRKFIAALGAAVTWLIAARSLGSKKVPIVGVLWHGTRERELSNPFYHWFRKGFAEVGYKVGTDIILEDNFADESDASTMYSLLSWSHASRTCLLPSPDAALSARIPMVGNAAPYASNGALLAYAPLIREGFTIGAKYVKRILAGEHASNLPVEQPTRLEMAVNIKTAKAMGIELPTSILLRADKVIE